jgi:hypothetical protein
MSSLIELFKENQKEIILTRRNYVNVTNLDIVIAIILLKLGVKITFGQDEEFVIINENSINVMTSETPGNIIILHYLCNFGIPSKRYICGILFPNITTLLMIEKILESYKDLNIGGNPYNRIGKKEEITLQQFITWNNFIGGDILSDFVFPRK